jgi:hypothetical protein
MLLMSSSWWWWWIADMRSRQIARLNRFRPTRDYDLTELSRGQPQVHAPKFDKILIFPRVGLTRFLRDHGVRLVIQM